MIHRNLFITLILYFIGDSGASVSPTGPDKRRYIMTKFEGLPKFYEELRSQNPQRESDLTDEQRVRICCQIFGSEVVINPGEDHSPYKKILKRNHRTTFEELFKKDETSKGVLTGMKWFRRRLIYHNSSQPRSFLVNGSEFKENTFACVIRNPTSQTKVDLYFVSDHAYNVNDLPSGERISGRFIFINNGIYALAEELPEVLLYLNFNGSNDCIKKRNRDKIAENWKNDPVCKLDSGRKIRLCTFLCSMTQAGCGDKIAVQEPCVRREFVLQEELHDEWTLSCKITRHAPAFDEDKPPTHSFEKEFYIAHTHCNNEAFVFREIDGKLEFRFKLLRVPVVVQ